MKDVSAMTTEELHREELIEKRNARKAAKWVFVVIGVALILGTLGLAVLAESSRYGY